MRGYREWHAQRFGHLSARTAQQTGELVFGQAVGHRCHGAQDGRRVGTNGDGHRVRLAGAQAAMLGKIECPAAVRQPAHDELVARQHLLAVNAQVLPRLVRPPRNHQAPGDERCHVAGPAVLDGQARKVDVLPLPHQFLAGWAAALFGRHVPQGLEQAAHAHHFLETLGRLGLLERRQQFAKGAQPGNAVHSHGAGHALGRAEQVGQYGHGVARGVFKQQRRATGAQHAVAQSGHFQVWRHRLGNAAQVAGVFKLGKEAAEVVRRHRGIFRRNRAFALAWIAAPATLFDSSQSNPMKGASDHGCHNQRLLSGAVGQAVGYTRPCGHC